VSVRRKRYNASQPRDPKGSATGGQWTASSGSAAAPIAPHRADYSASGKETGPLYHGGKQKITQIDPARLQARDYGFYGSGFYATASRDLAKAYGRSITEVRLKPGAQVLVSALRPENAPPALLRDVQAHVWRTSLDKAKARGREVELQAEVDALATDHLEWVRAVHRFGRDAGYDVIRHSDGEIVIINPRAVEKLR
jgi:hypothetical protein